MHESGVAKGGSYSATIAPIPSWLWRFGLKPHLTPKFKARRGGLGAGFWRAGLNQALKKMRLRINRYPVSGLGVSLLGY
jgi:hypothetical protein